MLDKNKIDPVLGAEIEEMLKQKGINTPIKSTIKDKNRAINDLSGHFVEIMDILGLDLKDDSLTDTPKRLAKMFVNEYFWGLDPHNFPKITAVKNKMNYDEMVLVKDISVMSVCEHHFVTIDGKAHVAYIPGDYVIGLSKMNRIVEYFSRRPQIQERLTEQIHAALVHLLKTDDVAVSIEATHYCVRSRGVEDINSSTVTNKLSGRFKEEDSLRKEFLHAI